MHIKDEDGQFYSRQHYPLTGSEVQVELNERRRREGATGHGHGHSHSHSQGSMSMGTAAAAERAGPAAVAVAVARDHYHHDYCDLDLGFDAPAGGKVLAPRIAFQPQPQPQRPTTPGDEKRTKFGILKNMPIPSSSTPQDRSLSPPQQPQGQQPQPRAPLLADRIVVTPSAAAAGAGAPGARPKSHSHALSAAQFQTKIVDLARHRAKGQGL